MNLIDDFSHHSVYSDPGRFAHLLETLPLGPEAAGAAARNLIMHYRGSGIDVPVERRSEIDSRWMDVILGVDQQRHGAPLMEDRELAERVAGCCRDFALVAVSVLRQQGIPARTRVGFTNYFAEGWHHDHVVTEYWDAGRWVRMDPELENDGTWRFDVRDMPTGFGAPLETAAEVWLAYRAGDIDPSIYGVDPGLPLHGPAFIRNYVIYELAHRRREELLLWDVWGDVSLELPDDVSLIDEVAKALVAADTGDATAEQRLTDLFVDHDQLHPGDQVVQLSPYDEPARTVSLRTSNAA